MSYGSIVKTKFKKIHHQHHNIQPMLEGYFFYDVTSWLVTLQICVYCNQTIEVVKTHRMFPVQNGLHMALIEHLIYRCSLRCTFNLN